MFNTFSAYKIRLIVPKELVVSNTVPAVRYYILTRIIINIKND